MLMYTYTHNPTCTLGILRTNREANFFFLNVFGLFVASSWCCLWGKNPVLSQLLVSCGFLPSTFSLDLVIMAQISLRFVKFGSSGN